LSWELSARDSAVPHLDVLPSAVLISLPVALLPDKAASGAFAAHPARNGIIRSVKISAKVLRFGKVLPLLPYARWALQFKVKT